uniref:Uncharacterized protein n=1 Tax=Riboviria sp. TaxID=2585031 RepID=A0A8B0RJ77_9VIRU|nr:hypothetical protein [Riboviria sp.]
MFFFHIYRFSAMATNAFSKVDEATDFTVVQKDTQVANSAAPNTSERAVNKYGQQLIKGGSVLGQEFPDAVVTAYTNLTNSPFALTALIFGSFGLVALALATNGPFDYLSHNLNQLVGTSENKIHGVFTKLTASFVAHLLNHKFLVYSGAAFGATYISKPSTKNAVLAAIVSFLVYVLRITAWETLAFAHLFFAHTQLRNPKHKLYVVAFLLATIVIGREFTTDVLGPNFINTTAKLYVKPIKNR